MTERECRIDDCGKPVKESGLCSMHAGRLRRHGDVHAFTHQRDRNLRRGADNPNWSGSGVTYGGAHIRVRKLRGKASAHKCADCGGNASQWSYDHADPAELTSEFGPYSADPDHYVPRCVPCHKAHDLSLIPPKPDTPIDLEAVRRLRGEGAAVRSIAKLLGVPYRRVERALDEMGLPRVVRRGAVPEPRCDQPMRPWRGVVGLCAKPQGHAGKHEGRRRPKTYLDSARAGDAA